MTSVQDVVELITDRRGGWVPRGLLGPTSEQLVQLAVENSWWFVEISLAGVADKKTLMRVLAEHFELSESFGANWDAFADSLWDVGEGREGAILRLKGLGDIPDMLAGPLAEILDARTSEGPRPLIIVADPPLPALAGAVADDTGEGEREGGGTGRRLR